MNTTVAIIIIAVLVVVVIAAMAWIYTRRLRSQRLRSHFGPEYDHAVHEFGSEAKAEGALTERQKRVEKIHIRSLLPEERERFVARWHDIQAHFVDDPSGSIHDADALVNEAMRARGYPMGEFEQRAEYISVDHPRVVRNYRAAHEIAMKRDRGEASTEDLRYGLVYYRDLFEELLELQGVR